MTVNELILFLYLTQKIPLFLYSDFVRIHNFYTIFFQPCLYLCLSLGFTITIYLEPYNFPSHLLIGRNSPFHRFLRKHSWLQHYPNSCMFKNFSTALILKVQVDLIKKSLIHTFLFLKNALLIILLYIVENSNDNLILSDSICLEALGIFIPLFIFKV